MLNSTNYTPIKKPLPCSLLQELEAQEDLFQDPSSLRSRIAQIGQLIDQTEKNLEAYLSQKRLRSMANDLREALLASETESERLKEVLHGQKE